MSDRSRDWAEPRDTDVRTSQEERDRVVERLRVHAGHGRLEVDELEERVEAALGARTRGELRELLSDLPETRRARSVAPARAIALGSAAVALLPLITGIAIIALAPHALVWTGWVVLGWWVFAGLPSAGFGFACSAMTRRRRPRRTAVV